MIDVWMIFTMTIPLLEIVGHSYSESLKKELAKESNDHTRKLSAIDSLPRNLVSVRPSALDESKHSDRRLKPMLCAWSIDAPHRNVLLGRLACCAQFQEKVVPIAALGEIPRYSIIQISSSVFIAIFCAVGLYADFEEKHQC